MEKFILKNGEVELTAYKWCVEKPKSQLILVHGLAEHAKRYDDFAKHLNSEGISVYSMDLRGHGESLTEGLGIFSITGGWEVVTDDINLLYDYAVKENPDVDINLFGHSMGSIFARALLVQNKRKYKKCVLSGVTVSKPVLRDVAPVLAGLVKKDKPSQMLNDMTFGAYNNEFKPAKTDFDWLSRDEKQVKKYIDDDLCGYVPTGSMFKDVANILLFTLKKANVNNMPKETPIFIVSGAKDPCGSNGDDARYLDKVYKAAGLTVTYKLYDDARHELVNEQNNAEVYADIAEFIKE